MKFQKGDSYYVDDNTKITDLVEAHDDNFDSVITEVDGYHPKGKGRKKIYNENSQKGYFILKGEGTIHVGLEAFDVKKEDFILVPENKGHALEGDFRALIVTSPPFNPADEEIK